VAGAALARGRTKAGAGDQMLGEPNPETLITGR
jgi:hypothetical protein